MKDDKSMDTKTLERLAVVETEMRNLKDVAYRIEGKLDQVLPTLVTVDQLKEVKEDIEELKHKRVAKEILVPIATAVGSSVLTVLIINFMTGR